MNPVPINKSAAVNSAESSSSKHFSILPNFGIF